jgi:hypothetical protein
VIITYPISATHRNQTSSGSGLPAQPEVNNFSRKNLAISIDLQVLTGFCGFCTRRVHINPANNFETGVELKRRLCSQTEGVRK